MDMDTSEPAFSLSADMLILMDDALSVLFDGLTPYLTRVNPSEAAKAVAVGAAPIPRQLWLRAV